MKSTFFFPFIIVLLAFTSCNEKVEENIDEIETDWNLDFSITSLQNQGEHKFIGVTEYDISSIVYTSNSINNIYSLKPRAGSYIELSGVKENYNIKSLWLKWNYGSLINNNLVVNESIDLLSLNYTLSGEVLRINLDNVLDDYIKKIDDPNGNVKIEISGICDYELNSEASLSIPIIVESKQYNPRFELF
jgi:hypothetical protein